MLISATNRPPLELEVDVLLVAVYQTPELSGTLAAVDKLLGGSIKRQIDHKEFLGKPREMLKLALPGGTGPRQAILVGLGEKEKADVRGVSRAIGTAAKDVAGKEGRRVAIEIDSNFVEVAVWSAMVACQGQDLYRKEKKLFPFQELHIVSRENSSGNGDSGSLKRGEIFADAVNLAKRLVNLPPADLYPESFAAHALDVAQATGLEIDVWDEPKLRAEKCGSMLAVGQGSTRAPRLVMLRHLKGGPNQETIALVGKGVTFDSGGLSIKPTDGMKDMKCDMAGAATVLATMQAVARLNLPVNVVGYMGLVENMVSGNSYKLGDVLTARSGKTIEVLNTDAEGRLVLADVLDVAVTAGAAKIVDFATLTGACLVALGSEVAGVMTNDQEWCDKFLGSSKSTGELAWQLPMFKEFGEQIKSEVADIKNVGNGRYGGTITAAKFLEEFVREKPWVHVDIAGPAWLESSKAWADGGGTGCFVRTNVDLLEKLSKG